MKCFINWMLENNLDPPESSFFSGKTAIKTTNMEAMDQKKIDKLIHISRTFIEKYPDKYIEALSRIAKDKEDEELKQAIYAIDPVHSRLHNKKHFGMGDEPNSEIDNVVPSVADAGMGDIGES